MEFLPCSAVTTPPRWVSSRLGTPASRSSAIQSFICSGDPMRIFEYSGLALS